MHRPVLGAIFVCLVFGCSKKSSSDASEAPGEAGGDDLTALEQQLAQRESELQAVGVAPQRRDNISAGAGGSDAAGAAGGDGAGSTATADATAPTPSSQPAPTAAQRTAEKVAPPSDDGDRCTRVCEISAAICELEDQICGLLQRHQGDARYQNACDRSVADCQLATEACNACTAN